jgi:hypothetical protein
MTILSTLAAASHGPAVLSVARGPKTDFQPSFDGHGWLVVINLAGMTAMFVLATMFIYSAGHAIWRNRAADGRRHPVTIWRLSLACFAFGIAVRCGGEAMSIWNWDPRDPAGTAQFLVLKRFLDPIALLSGAAGLCLSYLSARGMVESLRRRPFPIHMWASLPMLKRPIAIFFLSLVAAIGVVSTR